MSSPLSMHSAIRKSNVNVQTAEAKQGPLVLAIEDSVDMLDFLKKILNQQGYRFIGAIDGLEGLELARKRRPDLILMDLSLPHLDGLEATRRLKADPELKHIPVIAVTAHARPADAVLARQAGCDDYIAKPYSLRDLLSLVRRYAPAKTGS